MPARTSRIDARFFIGIALVVAAVAGVWLTISAARATTSVMVAAEPIVPGQVLSDDDVRSVEVSIAPVADAYVAAADFEAGVVATRAIAAGEFLPREAVQSEPDARTTVVVVDSATTVPSSVTAGSSVEVWVSEVDAEGAVQTPRILIADATVASVAESSGMLRSNDRSRLELVIPRTAVAAALEAIASSATLSVVPTGGAR